MTDTPKKPRRRLTFADRIRVLNDQIAKAEARVHWLRVAKKELSDAARIEAARKALEEAGA